MFPPAGGGRHELPLNNGRIGTEAPAKAVNPSKTGTGLIITSVVLGVVLAVSLLVNVGLGWKLCMKTRPIRPEEVSKALDVLKKSHSDEASLVRRALDAEYHRNNTLVKQLETANEDITALNERISELKASVNGLSRTNDYYDECIDRMKEWIDYYRTCVLDLDAGKQLGLVFRHTLEMALDDYKDEIAPKKVSRY